MTVKFNVVEHGNLANPSAPKKFYPPLVAGGRVSLRRLAEEIARISLLSTTEAVAMLEALLVVIPDELRGRISILSCPVSNPFTPNQAGIR